ncbi:MAG: DUF116 domain-containing protein, partial [Candidatus Promineifilaceae bacterium]
GSFPIEPRRVARGAGEIPRPMHGRRAPEIGLDFSIKLRQLRDEYRFQMAVVGGGTEARAKIRQIRPSVIIAVACDSCNNFADRLYTSPAAVSTI